MTSFKSLLVVMAVGLLIYTLMAVGNEGVNLFASTLPAVPQFGWQVRFADPIDPANFAALVSDRTRAIFVCDSRRFLQPKPRVDLRPAANDLRRGSQRHRLQHERSSHRSRQGRNQDVRRLPHLGTQRQ